MENEMIIEITQAQYDALNGRGIRFMCSTATSDKYLLVRSLPGVEVYLRYAPDWAVTTPQLATVGVSVTCCSRCAMWDSRQLLCAYNGELRTALCARLCRGGKADADCVCGSACREFKLRGGA